MSVKTKKGNLLDKFFISDKNSFLFLAVLMIVIAIIYYPSLFNGLIDWDDYEYITRNALLKNFSWQNIVAVYHQDRFIALPLNSIALQMKYTGTNPFYFHLVNVVIHIANSLLVFLLAKKLSKNNLVSLLTATMFALFPTRVESVAWVMQRKDLFYTLFFLISTLSYIQYINGKERKTYLILLVVLFGWLSSVSKVQALVLPFVLFLIDYYYGRKLTVLSVYEKIVVFITQYLQFGDDKTYQSVIILILFTNNFATNAILSLIKKNDLKARFIKLANEYLIFRKAAALKNKIIAICSYLITLVFVMPYVIFWVIKGFQYTIITIHVFFISMYNSPKSAVLFQASFSFFDRIFLYCYSTIFYLYQCLFPFNLSAMHPYPQKMNNSLPMVYYVTFAPLIIVFAIIIFLVYKYKSQRKLIVFGFGFFFLTIFMVSHIIPIEGRLITADRYSYLSYFGLFILIGFLIDYGFNLENVKKFRPILMVFLFSLFTVYSVYSRERISVWSNSLTFWTNVVEKQPDNYYAYFGVGNYYLAENNNEKAFEYYNKALQLNDKDPMIFNNLGLINTNLKKYDEAIVNFSTLITLSPDFSQAYNNRGNAYYYLKKYDNALIDYRIAFYKWNKNTDALLNKADLEAELNQKDSALNDYKLCLKTDSTNAIPYYKLGVFYYKQNDFPESIGYLKKSLQIQPDYKDALKALSLAESMITAIVKSNKNSTPKENNSMALVDQGLLKAKENDFKAAIELFNKAISEDPNNANAYKNRGNAKAAMNDFAGSIEDYTQATKLSPNDAGTYLNRGNSKYHLNDKTSCDDWIKAQELGNTKAEAILAKYCK